MKLFIRLVSHLKSYKGVLFGAFICMIAISIFNILIIPLAGHLTNSIAVMNFTYLNWVAVLGILIYFSRSLFMYGEIYLMSLAAQRVVMDIRVEVFEHLQDLSLDFYAKWKTGEVISRIINDIAVLQLAILTIATELIPQTLTVIGVTIYLFYLNWRLSLLTLLIMPLFIYAISRFGEQMREVSKKSQQKAADITSILQETISGARVIKSFTMEKQEIKRFHNEAMQSFDFSMKESQIDATVRPLMGFLQVLAVLAVVWYGGWEVVQGRLQPGNLVAFFAGIALLIDPIIVFSKTSITIQKALSSAERVYEIIDLEPTVRDADMARTLPHIKGEVSFRDVTFLYQDSDKHALKNISVDIKAGEVVALVGSSGAGKSTFVNMVPRFYDPASGQILIDGIDIRTVTLHSLRSQMGIVPQETMLFTGSIRDNVCYGKTDASADAIINAAKMANAHDFITKLTHGYDTLVGERGMNLSGGERQRIAIARAILRDPRILILDEATSSLDTESERLVQDAMDKLISGRTTFVIAHRLSTVQFADRILVFDGGHIVESGTHQQLLDEEGIYYKLYDLQFRDE
ncbi:MAG: ABC transporter ATP-binding protein [bacterium]